MTVLVPHTSRQTGMAPMRRSDPVREMEDLQDRMGQIIDGLFGAVTANPAARLSVTPANVEETDDGYVVELDVPGVSPEDINVEVREYELRVSGEVKARERKGILRRQARRIGEFEHVVALPGEVDPNRVEAKLADGVLTVRLGKSQAHQPRKVAVTT